MQVVDESHSDVAEIYTPEKLDDEVMLDCVRIQLISLVSICFKAVESWERATDPNEVRVSEEHGYMKTCTRFAGRLAAELARTGECCIPHPPTPRVGCVCVLCCLSQESRRRPSLPWKAVASPDARGNGFLRISWYAVPASTPPSPTHALSGLGR